MISVLWNLTEIFFRLQLLDVKRCEPSEAVSPFFWFRASSPIRPSTFPASQTERSSQKLFATLVGFYPHRLNLLVLLQQLPFAAFFMYAYRSQWSHKSTLRHRCWLGNLESHEMHGTAMNSHKNLPKIVIDFLLAINVRRLLLRISIYINP